MNGTVAETRSLARAVGALVLPDIDVVVAPPFTALFAAAEELRGSAIALGAQTMHYAERGPYTGEISPGMLAELGVAYVILGHSERRAYCGETEAAINCKVRAALAHGITPIVAVGETREEHVAGATLAKVTLQTREAFAELDERDVARCALAYEPIWAIGTGLGDEPESADRVMGQLRAAVAGLADARILYGGSMKPDNAAAFLAQSNIDGGLIGGASLDAASFGAIATCARVRTAA